MRRRPYPPIPIPPVKPMPGPGRDYLDQYSLPKALEKGTLFKWLYDPYEKKGFYPPFM
ncbi:spore coat associated protein CotJA [Tepidibacillus sp. HK-1]|uniref:spore coat associated protein CotJA n=1 Tax=Tepidibacillus sp. HK-1 TaxID=1883407 RepID=UPI000855B0EB|nr:spore coat associated protein CotJA [Tepidibacillus sp. HK-1]GBF10945.1 spore coat associated protein JA [Tepidibacillus sp. HK-1]